MADTQGLDAERIRKINEAAQQLTQQVKTMSVAAQVVAAQMRQEIERLQGIRADEEARGE